jgi:hypothetical protein
VILAFAAPLNSQTDLYRKVDTRVDSFTLRQTSSIDSLVTTVRRSFRSNDLRVRAFYTWIARNITYDMDLLGDYEISANLGLLNISSMRTQHPDTVFKYRRGVCEGICLLMNKFCDKIGVPSRMIAGITRLEDDQVVEKILHTWNVVKPDTAWKIIDITWSGGYVNLRDVYVKKFSDNYFFSPPSGFIKDHWPLDPMWQLLPYPVTKSGFMNGTFTSRPLYAYRDSISRYMRLSAEEQEYTDLRHYVFNDPDNKILTTACDHYIYNHTVTKLNLASLYFEDYIQYAKTLEGKPVHRNELKKCLKLLEEPRKYLEDGLRYAANRNFYSTEMKTRFQEMIGSSEERLKQIAMYQSNYRKMLASLR